jgi:aspartyl-tRNA(Asn)/glutamyl-tRNA(Gln) amidotransferase subunit B
VSKPEIHSPDEAYQYLTELKSILIYLGVSDCDMEKGSLRCDANISVRPKAQKIFGTKTEIKNLNSFKFVASALEYEASRQIALLKEGKRVEPETRLWDEEKQQTRLMRSKEEVQDYRYFPDPDLMPFRITREQLDTIKSSLPELPRQRKARFIKQYQLPEYDAGVLLQDKALSDYFDECVRYYPNPKSISNWLMSELLRYLNENKIDLKDFGIRPQRLVGLLRQFDKGKITATTAKEVWAEMLSNPLFAEEIVEKKGLLQITDDSALETYVKDVIEKNPKIVGDYKTGKKPALEALVGQAMRLSKGKAQPDKVREFLKKHLGN